MAKHGPGVKTKKPPPLLWKQLTVDGWGLFQLAIKGFLAITGIGAAFKPDEAFKILDYVKFKKVKGELAWALVYRAMAGAIGRTLRMGDLFIDYEQAAIAQKRAAEFDGKLAAAGLLLDEQFFAQPTAIPYTREVSRRCKEWLVAAGVGQSDAEMISWDIPRLFAIQLSKEWRENRSELETLLPKNFETPFTSAEQNEDEWVEYAAWLHQNADRRVFDEDFGLMSVYVPLRAYIDSESKPGKLTRLIGLAENLLDHWLEQRRPTDDIRVIEGDPGAGKSSLARMYAATRFGRTVRSSREQGRIRWRILYAALHHVAFDTDKPLEEALASYYTAIRTPLRKPLDSSSPDPTLLILDGLDELAKSGHVGLDVIRAFMSKVTALQTAWNHDRVDAHLLVLVCGRPIAADVAKKEIRRIEAVLNLLPYVVAGEKLSNAPPDGKSLTLSGQITLLKDDQRKDWWEKYIAARGRNPAPEIYEEIRANRKLEPITAQPLLNYLVAFLKESSPDSKLPENLCDIYNDLLLGVWRRGWEREQVPTLGRIEFDAFSMLLEEIALTAWQAGNSRGVRVSQVEEKLSGDQKQQLQLLESQVKDGLLRLLLGFFMRPQSRVRGEETYEFTHKTFSEYLITRRLLRELRELCDDWQQFRGKRQWKDEDALSRCVLLLGQNRIDTDLLSFLSEGMAGRHREDAARWQELLTYLLEAVLSHGLPIQPLIRISAADPTFSDLNRRALNTEDGLLRLLKACVEVTRQPVVIRGLAEQFGEMVDGRWRPLFKRESMSYLSFRQANLSGLDLSGTYLVGADLSQVKLDRANLTGAQLGFVTPRIFLTATKATHEAWDWGDITVTIVGESAKLTGADLRHATLTGVSLGRADISEADLTGSHVFEADTRPASDDGTIWLHYLSFDPRILLATIGEPKALADGRPPKKNWRKKQRPKSRKQRHKGSPKEGGDVAKR